MAGKLFIVATPIGNLEDLSPRALRVLREADLIAAEDTRHTGHLLTRFELRKPLVSYHQFSEAKRTAEFLRHFADGKSIALVSDAGMPGVSDPGERLIRAAVAAGVAIEVIPGPSAPVVALAGSGFPMVPY
jgi:16S rRNA (cytidine1402-2'-O)-methyltransferase